MILLLCKPEKKSMFKSKFYYYATKPIYGNKVTNTLKKPYSLKAFPDIILLRVNDGMMSNIEFKQIMFFISQPSSMNSTLDKKMFLKLRKNFNSWWLYSTEQKSLITTLS